MKSKRNRLWLNRKKHDKRIAFGGRIIPELPHSELTSLILMLIEVMIEI
jgi:hypothetical protein